MNVSLRTNIPALQAINQLNLINNEIAKTNLRITTGKRINSASDDPAGFAIAQRMRTQLNGIDQASRNVQNGASAISTADKTLVKIQETLSKIKDYALQASDELLTTADRSAIQVSVNQLVTEIDRLASTASFNSKRLLDGSFQGVTLQIGANAGDTFDININSVSAGGLGVSGLSVSTVASASGAIATVQSAIDTLAIEQANVGSYAVRLDNISDGLVIQKENQTAALGTIQDADTATDVVNLAMLKLRQASAGQAISMALINQQSVLSLLLGNGS